jgi:hypothetical protein
MISSRFTYALLAVVVFHSGAADARCNPKVDPDCKTLQPSSQGKGVKKKTAVGAEAVRDKGFLGGPNSEFRNPGGLFGGGGWRVGPTRLNPGPIIVDPGTGVGASVGAAENARPLQPVRSYLRAADIPPPGVGAYGLVVFHSKPTSASRAKLLMVCKSFVAHFPRSERASVPASDQMVTIWPVETPDAQETQKDDCDYAIDNYDLVAAESAITDATLQHGDFRGDGPFLVGWSPSKARALPDALVLVIDMSSDITQDEIDHQFLFWKNEIVQDPSKWRGGWSMDRIRVALRGYADTYGPAIMESVKFFTGKSQ